MHVSGVCLREKVKTHSHDTVTVLVRRSYYRTGASYWALDWRDAGRCDACLAGVTEECASTRSPLPAGYLAASLQYGDGVDDVEFVFTRDGSKTVLFAARSRVNKASPPGCFTPGCVNGPRNRGRMEELQRELGWLPLETDEDKKWVPLLLH